MMYRIKTLFRRFGYWGALVSSLTGCGGGIPEDRQACATKSNASTCYEFLRPSGSSCEDVLPGDYVIVDIDEVPPCPTISEL